VSGNRSWSGLQLRRRIWLEWAAEAERKEGKAGEWWKEVGREEVVGWRERSDDKVEKLEPPVEEGLKRGL